MQLCRWSSDSRCVERAVEVFGVLVDGSRLHSILALGDAGGKSVNRLANVADKSPAVIAQHLSQPRMARGVALRQDGQRVVYRLANERALQLVSNAIFQVERSAGGTPWHHRTEVPRTQSKAD